MDVFSVIVILIIVGVLGAFVYFKFIKKEDEIPIPPIEPPVDPPVEPSRIVSIAASGARSRGISNISKLTIASADIFAYAYDYGYNRFDSLAAVSPGQGTYANDPQAIALIEGLGFTPSSTITEVVEENLPNDRIDVLYFDNKGHQIKVQDGSEFGTNYGDTGWNGVNPRKCQFSGSEFTHFDVVFINRELFTRIFLFNESFGDTTANIEFKAALTEDEYDIAWKVFNEVRMNEGPSIFIPFDAILQPKDNKEIVITLDLNNLIDEITDTHLMFEVDSDGSPLTYTVQVNQL